MQDPMMRSPEETSVSKPKKKASKDKKVTRAVDVLTWLQPIQGQKFSKQKTSVLPKRRNKKVIRTEDEFPWLQPIEKGQESSKRSFANEASPLFQQPEKSTSDSLADSSTSGNNEYRALRHKYLLLEEDSFGLGRELTEVENEIKTLEEEKLALLDELVVLEGLVDPSELQTR